jgi:RimJ/RimL family protein N-acetyltransferase
MKLKELTLENCERVRQWRNECLESLRTPFPLTKEMQEKFYHDVICDKNAKARYWGVWIESNKEIIIPETYDTYTIKGSPEYKFTDKTPIFIGMVGLENIEWENRRAEISIILNPEYRVKGYGEQAVDLLLEQGFFYMNFEMIWGECYTCNPALQFWKKLTKKYLARCTDIPFTKFWKYQYYDSFYFAFLKEDYNYVKNNT